MDNESFGQHLIFIIILVCILFLSYCSLPTADMQPVHKTSKKIQTRTHKTQNTEKLPSSPPKTILTKPGVENATKNNEESLLPGIILMNNPHYKTHKKGIVKFTHQKHVKDYSISCGSCHHDKTGKPLELTSHDRPRGCIECHKGTKKPKGEKLGKKEKIAKYHFEALHKGCIGCHKEYNKKSGSDKGKGPAPTSCKNCHPKK